MAALAGESPIVGVKVETKSSTSKKDKTSRGRRRSSKKSLCPSSKYAQKLATAAALATANNISVRREAMKNVGQELLADRLLGSKRVTFKQVATLLLRDIHRFRLAKAFMEQAKNMKAAADLDDDIIVKQVVDLIQRLLHKALFDRVDGLLEDVSAVLEPLKTHIQNWKSTIDVGILGGESSVTCQMMLLLVDIVRVVSICEDEHHKVEFDLQELEDLRQKITDYQGVFSKEEKRAHLAKWTALKDAANANGESCATEMSQLTRLLHQLAEAAFQRADADKDAQGSDSSEQTPAVKHKALLVIVKMEPCVGWSDPGAQSLSRLASDVRQINLLKKLSDWSASEHLHKRIEERANQVLQEIQLASKDISGESQDSQLGSSRSIQAKTLNLIERLQERHEGRQQSKLTRGELARGKATVKARPETLALDCLVIGDAEVETAVSPRKSQVHRSSVRRQPAVGPSAACSPMDVSPDLFLRVSSTGSPSGSKTTQRGSVLSKQPVPLVADGRETRAKDRPEALHMTDMLSSVRCGSVASNRGPPSQWGYSGKIGVSVDELLGTASPRMLGRAESRASRSECLDLRVTTVEQGKREKELLAGQASEGGTSPRGTLHLGRSAMGTGWQKMQQSDEADEQLFVRTGVKAIDYVHGLRKKRDLNKLDHLEAKASCQPEPLVDSEQQPPKTEVTEDLARSAPEEDELLLSKGKLVSASLRVRALGALRSPSMPRDSGELIAKAKRMNVVLDAGGPFSTSLSKDKGQPNMTATGGFRKTATTHVCHPNGWTQPMELHAWGWDHQSLSGADGLGQPLAIPPVPSVSAVRTSVNRIGSGVSCRIESNRSK